MEYQRFENQIVVRLDCGDEISTSLLKIAAVEGIQTAVVSGIGATDNVEVGVFNTETKSYRSFNYTGTHEITSLTGNLTLKEDKPYCHLHITLAGEDGTVVGGHLLNGIISLTAEIFITVIQGKTERSYEADSGINRIVFKK